MISWLWPSSAVSASYLGLAGTARHQGVIARVDEIARPVDLQDLLEGLRQPAFLLLLDGVTDPHNLGACLRVADAMGVQAVLVPKDRSVGLTATVAKVASGAADTPPLIPVTILSSTLDVLNDPYSVYSLPARWRGYWAPRDRACVGSPASDATSWCGYRCSDKSRV